MFSSSRGPTTLAPGSLGTLSVAAFGITNAAPTLILAGLVVMAWAVTGIVGIGLVMAGLGAVLALWAVGYVTMARHVPANAGSLYVFVAHGLGQVVGLAAAGVQILSYNLLQVALFGIVGAQATSMLDLPVPWWVVALASWGMVAILGTRGIGVSSRLLSAAVAVELVYLTLVVAIDLTHPAPGGLSLETLDLGAIRPAALGPAVAIAAASFVGVESLPLYGEETRTPRDIQTGTALVIALMTLVYTLGPLATTIAVGPADIVTAARQQGSDLIFTIAAQHWGGQPLVTTGRLLLLLSAGCGLLAYHNAVNRAMFALGREMGQGLWGQLGRLHPRHRSPIVASLTQTAIGATTILIVATMGWDPMTHLFYYLGVTGGLGVFTLMTLASAATVAHHTRNPHQAGPWTTRILPTTATLLMTGLVTLMVTHFDTLLGVDSASPARWALPALIPLAAVPMVGRALWLRRHHPHVLARVGLGVAATALDHTPLEATR